MEIAILYDYIVVGAGFSGSIFARYIAEELDKKVLLLEKRNHIAGNAYDYKDEHGILVHKYGPHIFHTNFEKVYSYLIKYSKWEKFFLKCNVYMLNKFTPSPFNFATIDEYFTTEKAQNIKDHIRLVYGDKDKATIVEMLECNDPIVREYADFLFKYDYSLYTAKQWGISPAEIDISVLKRVPVLFSYKTGYFDDLYQMMPKEGYTKVFEDILNHENITIKLNTDAKNIISITENNEIQFEGKVTSVPVIYTGAIDELFENRFGKLPYRSLKFDWITYKQESYQDAPVVAYPEAKDYTRITEYKKLPVQNIKDITTIAIEYPLQYENNINLEPYYPIPTINNQNIYESCR